MKPKTRLAMDLEEERHMRAVVAIVDGDPGARREVAYAILGAAIGFCDMFGADAEEFIAGLRARFAKPSPLVPPDEVQS